MVHFLQESLPLVRIQQHSNEEKARRRAAVMTQITLKARVGSDGVLHLHLGEAQAGRDVQVTIETTPAEDASSSAEYSAFLRATAGAWHGEFERLDQGEYETRDAME
jgi:hypothetical protein